MSDTRTDWAQLRGEVLDKLSLSDEQRTRVTTVLTALRALGYSVMREDSPTGYCCKQMREVSTLRCDRHALPGDCPDVLMVHSDRHGPGLPVRDGGGSFVAINFCPWCGADASQALTVGDRDV